MKTMTRRSILTGAAAVALSFCALTAFAAPTIESNSADTASASPRSALSENSTSSSTVLTVDKNGGDGVHTKLQDALDAIPDNAGDVTILVNSSINQDYNEFTYEIPSDKNIASLTFSTASSTQVVIGQWVNEAYSALFANGIPVYVDNNVRINGCLYGGSNGSDLAKNTSITVKEGALVARVYGGSLNANLVGNTAITIEGEAFHVIGGSRAQSSSVEPDTNAPVEGDTAIAVSETGTVTQKIFGGGYALVSENETAVANVSGSTHLTIDGKFSEAYGGGYAGAKVSQGNASGTAQVGGTFIVIGGNAEWASSSLMRVFGGGLADGYDKITTNSLNADVHRSTSIQAREDNTASTTQPFAKMFGSLFGGGYALHPGTQANVYGDTFIDTARPGADAKDAMAGGGLALGGGTANVEGTTHVEVFGIDGEYSGYENAYLVVGGGVAQEGGSSDSPVTSATAGNTEVIIHPEVQFSSDQESPAAIVGGGFAVCENSNVDVAGTARVTILDGTHILKAFVGGGFAYPVVNRGSFTNNAPASASVGSVEVKIGKNCQFDRVFAGGGYAGTRTSGGTVADTAENVTMNVGSVTIDIGSNNMFNSYVAGGSYLDRSVNIQANVESIDTSIGDGTVINGNLTVGGGFANNATDSEANVLGDVRTTFGNNVTTRSFIGGGLAYNGSSDCTVNVDGAVSSMFGNSYADPYEFIAAGYVFYNTTSCTADVGSVETSFGENAALSDVSGAGWVRSNSTNGSADVDGSASFTLGSNSKLATKFVGGGQVQASTDSHANVGTELGSDAAAVTTKMAAGLTLPLMYGGGCVSSSTNSQADIAGNVENTLDGESAAGSFNGSGSFNGGGCVKDNSTSSQANIAGNVESTLTGFSFASATQDYFTRVVGNGAVLGSSASYANTQGDVTTRLTSCTINGNGDGNNSKSMPYLGGRSDSDVGGNAMLILQDSKLVNQTLRTQKTYSGAIGGTLTVRLVGSMNFDDWSYPEWKNREIQLVFGDDAGTPTDVTMIGILCYDSPLSATVLPHATVSLTNGFDDKAYHLLGLRNLTVSEDATLAVTTSTAQAKLSGNLSGAGTISLPAGGSIVGDGVLDGNLSLLINEKQASATAGQTYFDFSDQSTGSVTPVDLDSTLKLVDASDAGHRTWTIAENTHTVAFDSLEGTDVEKQTIIHGSHAVEPDPAPTREHYALEGWYETADFSSDPWSFDADVVTEDITLYAKWTPVEYTVTFDARGGSPTPLALQVKYGATVTEPAQQPTRADFMFGGWYADAAGEGDPWNFADDTVSGDLTLHAKWVDGVRVTVTVTADEEGVEHGSVNPTAPQVYTGTPLEYTLTPDYGYQIGSVAVNGDPLPYEPQKDLRSAIVTYEPTVESSIVVTFIPLKNETASDIIDNLPSVEPGDAPDVVEEKQDTVLDAKLDYESMPDEEKKAVEQEVVDKLNEAVTSLPNVNVKVELAISPELGANVEIPEKDKSRFISAVSKDEIEQLKSGTAQLLKVVVNIKNIEAPDDEDEKAALESSLGSLEIGQHFSASVTKQLFADPTESNPLQSDPITTLPAPVQLTFQVPQSLLDPGEGTARSFAVARTHFAESWQAELRPDEDGDETNESVTISTDRFSTYSIVYQDTHTVTFMDGASVLATAPVANGGTLTRPTDPMRKGYEFDGWYASADFVGNPYGFDAPVTDPFTLYAKWTAEEPPAPVEHAVSFESNGGAPVDGQQVADGGNASKPADPTREGYDFAGWYADSALSETYDFDAPVTADLVLYAKWEQIFIKVTFFAGDDVTSPDTQSVAYGEKAGRPADPERAGYDFAGWYASADFSGDPYDFGAPVTGPLTLYAKWAETAEPPAAKHEVAFASNGGTLVDPQIVADGELAVAPDDPTREGYRFAGWFANAGLTAAWDFDRDPVTGPVTLYAKWERIEHAVSFESNGGAPVDAQSIAHGDRASKPGDPTCDGFAFVGWFSDVELSKPYDFNTPVTAPLTLYAKWAAEEPPAPVEHAVSFESNGGAPVAAQRVADGGRAARPADPERAGYDFAGWYASADFSGDAYDFGAPVTGPLTLYAKWTAKTAPLPVPDDNVTPQQPDVPKELPSSSSTTAEKLAPTGDAATLPLAVALVALVAAGALTLRTRRRH